MSNFAMRDAGVFDTVMDNNIVVIVHGRAYPDTGLTRELYPVRLFLTSGNWSTVRKALCGGGFAVRGQEQE